MAAQPELLFAAQTELGECPVWDSGRDCLFFMDITEKALHRFDWASSAATRIDLPSIGGGLVLGRDGALLAGLQTGIYRVDPDRASISFIVDPEPDRPDNRLNEAKCDPQGRLWIGSMPTRDRSPSGRLYRMDKDGRIVAVLDEIVIPNALVWLNDEKMLFADSFRRVIWSFRYDGESGMIADRRVFADCRDEPGIPDGIALDAEGCLWNAQFGGGRVVRYAPDGRIIAAIPLPATQVTSCAFAGDGLKQLVVITTKRLLDDRSRHEQTHAGDIFVLEAPAPGAPAPMFG
jgi:sugar lactone lactonase YvrE